MFKCKNQITSLRCLAAAAAIGSLALLIGCQPMSSNQGSNANIDLVIGTYSQQGSEGVYGLTYHSDHGTFSEPHLMARADNPSFIAVGSGGHLYVVNELGNGQLTTYRRDNGALEALGVVPTEGASPCYVALSPDEQFIATANYMGGNVSIFALDENKVPVGPAQVVQHRGSGPHERQEAPHAHWVQWHRALPFIYAVDLGIDEVKVYGFDDSGRAQAERTALQLQPGDGPRHLSFHPQQSRAYILNELSNTVTVAQVLDDGTLQEQQRISTLPDDFDEHSQAGHIYISEGGQNLYVSNRGHDSIVVFDISDEGALTWSQTVSTNGAWPRHFAILPGVDTLLVANQESRNIVAFTINGDGTLTATGEVVEVPQATFVGQLR